MSEALGPVSLLPGPGHQPTFGLDGDQPAPAALELLDAEVRRLLDDGDEQARRTLAEHRAHLDRLVEALLAAETLDAEDAYRAAGIPLPEHNRTIDDAERPATDGAATAGAKKE